MQTKKDVVDSICCLLSEKQIASTLLIRVVLEQIREFYIKNESENTTFMVDELSNFIKMISLWETQNNK